MTDTAGGLVLPDTVGPGYDEQVAIHQQYNTFDDVETQLAMDGFHPEEPPQVARPRITAELLNHPNDKQYTEIYASLQAWYDYTINYYRRIQAKIAGIEAEVDAVGRAIRKQIADNLTDLKKAPKPTEVKNMIADHPRVVELEQEKLKLTQAEMLMKSHVDSIDRDLKTASRNIEMRKMDRGQGRRSSGVGYGG
jgi:hypothetical protein